MAMEEMWLHLKELVNEMKELYQAFAAIMKGLVTGTLKVEPLN